MKIELKKVDYSERASEETYCFYAEVYIDGAHVGSVQNNGQGGPHIFRGKFEDRLNEYGKGLPRVTSKIKSKDDPTGFFTYQPDAESLINDTLDDFLTRRDLKRSLAAKILFTKTTKPGLFESKRLKPEQKHLIKDRDEGRIKAIFRDTDKILNFLPFDDALKIFKENSPI